jgi:hypothetical protein
MLKRLDPDNGEHLFGQPRSRQRRHRKYQHAAAASRAFTGAKFLLGIPIQAKTQAQAAELVGSNRLYIAAAAALLEAEVPGLVESVSRGDVSLLVAAASVRKLARLVRAYRKADRGDRKALGKAVGIDAIFDDSIAPLL